MCACELKFVDAIVLFGVLDEVILDCDILEKVRHDLVLTCLSTSTKCLTSVVSQ